MFQIYSVNKGVAFLLCKHQTDFERAKTTFKTKYQIQTVLALN